MTEENVKGSTFTLWEALLAVKGFKTLKMYEDSVLVSEIACETDLEKEEVTLKLGTTIICTVPF